MTTLTSPAMNDRTPEVRIAHLETELRRTDSELRRTGLQLQLANMLIAKLQLELRRERIIRLGPTSEKLSDLQMELLHLEPSITADEVNAEAARPVFAATQPEQETKTRKAHPGRQTLSESLPRTVVTAECPAEDRVCGCCGKETSVIGYDESEELDKEPAKYFVRVTRREKRACRSCDQATVKTAAQAPKIVEKGLAADGVVIDTVIGKYCDHLPLYRQSAILQRETGVVISRATLDGWVMRVGELLGPVVNGMRTDLLKSPYVQADETTVDVQMHIKTGSNHEAWLWQYGTPKSETVFEFQMGRGRDGPKKFLGNFDGILQSDGYQVYDGIGGPKLRHIGCWAHARRKFVDAVKVNPRDEDAVRMVAAMDDLFAVERKAKENGLTPEQRQQLRREVSLPLADKIHADGVKLTQSGLPQQMTVKGAVYLTNQWTRLRRCLELEEAEISNNLAENSMRPVALGRKNWLHIGSVSAGPKVAAILSVVESCRRLGVSARQYLADVLPGLGRKTLSEAQALTPAKWAARNR